MAHKALLFPVIQERILPKFIVRLSLAAATVLVAASAMAEGGQGIGLAGAYGGPTNVGPSLKTREEVRAELATSRGPSTSEKEQHNREIVQSVTGITPVTASH